MDSQSPYEVQFDDRSVRLARQCQEEWSFLWQDVAVIGYRTTASGPWFDDYFLVFVLRDGRRYDIPLDWTGASELSDKVEDMSGTVLTARGTLVNCVEEDSVIVWPAQRAGERIEDS